MAKTGIYQNQLWDELIKESIPEWMIDAKFGMYTHWEFILPAHGGPDYVKELYSQMVLIERE